MPTPEPAKIHNQDLEHQRDKALVNDKGVKVTPQKPGQKPLEPEDRDDGESVRKFEESLARLPPD